MNGNLSPRTIEKLAGEGTLLVHLDAPDDVITERIAARAGGDDARLTGDDLVGATPDHRAAVLYEAQHRRAELSTLGTSHRLNVADPDPAAHVSALADLLEARHGDHR